MRKAEYFSKDFEWEDLRAQVENDPSFSYHLLPFEPTSFSLNSVATDQSRSSAADGSHAWNSFHHRHSSGKFFKERRYLLEEFPELVNWKGNSKVLEVGCGNGSTVLPILRGNENIVVYACDCSTEALDRVKETIDASNIAAVEHHFHPFCCDFSVTTFPTWLACNPCRENFTQTSQQRLTGLYDMTMLRFEEDKRVQFREYMRSDGTRSYFFCLDTVRDLFVGAGFKQLELEYCCVKSVNRRKGKSMQRVWVHGKFQKPV
ncbi:uncharacterized protein LOC126619159 isoform X2 [Malus sylvestris]|uniref:uncharacterized protein LOC126619159 isoform X2 n=1 Tax=Malus sylvestris TaxID=3752 RepID=UPI0021AD3A6F|nr:uncharacterized protein LOC126619159 isoform X2 [Malus sylvestris]